MSLSQARKAALEAKDMIADEVDPGAEKQKAKLAERKAETIKDLADAYIELYARPNKRTWAEDRRILNKDVLPSLHR